MPPTDQTSQRELVNLGLVDSQIAISFLEELVEKLLFLGSIAPDVMAHRDELAQYAGAEITRIVRDQRVLEKRFEELVKNRSAYKGVTNRKKHLENQEEIQRVCEEMRQSTKLLCRNLKENPFISENLLKVQGHRQEITDLFQRTIVSLQEKEDYAALAKKIAEDKEAHDSYLDLVHREKQAAAALKSLQHELEDEQRQHMERMEQKNVELQRLRAVLRELQKTRKEETVYAERCAIGATDFESRVRDVSLRGLEDELRNVEGTLELEVKAFEEMNGFFERTHQRLLDELTHWSAKKDRDVEMYKKNHLELGKQRQELLDEIALLTEEKTKELDDKETREENRAFEERMVETQKKVRMVRMKYVAKRIIPDWVRAYEIVAPEIEEEKKKKRFAKK